MLAPQIVGIVGKAGSGKDTVASMALEALGADRFKSFALADPMKEFAKNVFGFTDWQLWGPSAARNAIDARFDFSPDLVEEPGVPTFWDKVLRRKPHDVVRHLTPEEILNRNQNAKNSRNRAWMNFNQQATAWLQDVLPPGHSLANAQFLLKRWMHSVMFEEHITPRFVLQTLGTEFGRSISENIWIDRGLRHAQAILASGRWAFIRDVRFLNEAVALRKANAALWMVRRPGMDESATAKAGVAGHASEKDQDSPEMLGYCTVILDNASSLDSLREQVRFRTLSAAQLGY